MTRTQRLLTLLQILKENRYPVTADSLASQLHISVRSVYRDIETLRCREQKSPVKPASVIR